MLRLFVQSIICFLTKILTVGTIMNTSDHANSESSLFCAVFSYETSFHTCGFESQEDIPRFMDLVADGDSSVFSSPRQNGVFLTSGFSSYSLPNPDAWCQSEKA